MLVGWHYVKQGFGVVNVPAARQGFRLDTWERRAILFHCFAGWAYAGTRPHRRRATFEERASSTRASRTPVARGSPASPRARDLVRRPRGGRGPAEAHWQVHAVFRPSSACSRASGRGRSSPAPTCSSGTAILALTRSSTCSSSTSSGRTRRSRRAPKFGAPSRVRLAFPRDGRARAFGAILFHFLPEFLDLAFWKKTPGRRADPIGDTPFFAAPCSPSSTCHCRDHVIWRRENPETKYLQDVPKKPAPALAAVPERLAA